MRDDEWWDRPHQPEPSGRAYRVLAWLVVVMLAVAGLLTIQRANDLAADRAADRSQQRTIAKAPRPVRGPFSSTEVDRLAAKVTPSLVDVETEIFLGFGGAGTGIVLSTAGEVLTNNHVINGAQVVEVVTKNNQKRYSAEVVGYDRNHDIALLRINDPKRLTPAAIGDSAAIRVGEPILGIGNAGGKGGRPIRAPGTVNALNRSINTSDEMTGSNEQLKGLIEVLADIRPGDSGGPLVNEAGQVIGVNTAASVRYRTNIPNGTGYAIPINDAMSIVQVIRAGRSTGEVHVGPTGVIGVAVSGPAVGPDGTVSPVVEPGAKVTAITSGSPAESAGLRRGDTIVGLDGVPVDSPTRLTAIVGQHGPGDRLPLEWIDTVGQRRTGSITLAEGPPF